MKNKLMDLNDHLFEQLERLNDDGLKGNELKAELQRAKAMGGLATQVIGNARLVLDAQIAKHEYRLPGVPEMIGIEKK